MATETMVEAGRDIDAMIGAHLANMAVCCLRSDRSVVYPVTCRGKDVLVRVPPYSATLTAARQIVNEMERRGYTWALRKRGERETRCDFHRERRGTTMYAETAPMAICLAALCALSDGEGTIS